MSRNNPYGYGRPLYFPAHPDNPYSFAHPYDPLCTCTNCGARSTIHRHTDIHPSHDFPPMHDSSTTAFEHRSNMFDRPEDPYAFMNQFDDPDSSSDEEAGSRWGMGMRGSGMGNYSGDRRTMGYMGPGGVSGVGGLW